VSAYLSAYSVLVLPPQVPRKSEQRTLGIADPNPEAMHLPTFGDVKSKGQVFKKIFLALCAE
jgi:hypothetical protein